MSLTVSGPIKVFAVVAALAGLALVGGMMFLGRPPAEADAAPILLPKKKTTGPLAAIGKAQQVATKANAAVAGPAKVAAAATGEPTPVVAAAKPKAVAKPKPLATAKPKPKPKPKVAVKPRLVAANGLPTRIVRALRDRPVVIVALWAKGGKIDELARDEAAKGAASAGAGFVALNVLGDAREAEALTLKLGVVLRAPGILIFTRPDMVSFTLGGFQDHETVAQAAANALR
jgi:hypothetical protein